MRVADELRGSSASLRRAANRSSGGSDMLFATSLSFTRFAAYSLTSRTRRLFFSTELFFAIVSGPISPWPASFGERKLKRREQSPRFVIRSCRGADRNVHAPDRIDLVIVDLGKHAVLFQAHRIIAAPVEAFPAPAAEVANARQRNRHKAVDEIVHAVAAQRHLCAERHVLAHLEVRDRLARLCYNRLLSCDERKIAHG